MPAIIPGPGQDVLPAADDALFDWGTNFNTLYDPVAWGTTAPAIEFADGAVSDFGTALAAATNPSTRTAATVAAKDAARDALEPLLRNGVRVVVAQYRAGFGSAAALADLGIRTPKTTRTRIEAPVDSPLVAVDAVVPAAARLRLTQVIDGAPVTDRRFPAGVAAIELYARPVGGAYQLRRVVKRVNITADVSDLTDGMTYEWAARYINPRGERGPLSPPAAAPVWNPA